MIYCHQIFRGLLKKNSCENYESGLFREYRKIYASASSFPEKLMVSLYHFLGDIYLSYNQSRPLKIMHGIPCIIQYVCGIPVLFRDEATATLRQRPSALILTEEVSLKNVVYLWESWNTMDIDRKTILNQRHWPRRSQYLHFNIQLTPI